MTATVIARYGSTHPTPEERASASVKRYGSVIGLKPEQEQYYRDLHANAWPTVLDRIRKSNIRNFSIYIAELDGKKFLFSYFEYHGHQFETDMRSLAEDPETQRWWKQTDPCQIQLPTRKPGAQWSDMEPVFLME